MRAFVVLTFLMGCSRGPVNEGFPAHRVLPYPASNLIDSFYWTGPAQRYPGSASESTSPFGPWRVFYNEMPWGGSDHSCYLGQIPGKWFSADGLGGTIMFAGDYVNRKGEYYGLMTRPFSMVLRKPD